MIRSVVLLMSFTSLVMAQQFLPAQPPLPAAQNNPLVKGKKVANPDPVKEDARSLQEMKLAADTPDGLIAYFKGRTLSETDLARMKAIIERMGDESFEVRVKASEEATALGLAAIGPLRNASLSNPDPEIAFRAFETLKGIEKVPQSFVASAAARALAKSQHAEAAAALLGFLPMADNATVDDDIRTALKTLALRDGKPADALVKALKDPNAVRRAAAAVALIDAALNNPAIREEIATLVSPLLATETDADAKFRLAFIMATTGQNPAAFTALAEALPGVAQQRGRIWLIEDVLLQLAGAKAPSIKLASNKNKLEQAREEWLNWMKGNLKPEDYKAFKYKPRTNGHIQMMWADNNWGGGRIIELGPELQQRWRVNGVMVPADFRMMPNGNIELLEHNYSRLREIDMKGVQKSSRQFNEGQPVCIRHLENGHILLGFRHAVIEYDDKWNKLNTFTRPNQDILSVSKLGNGPIWVLVQGGPPELIRLTDKFEQAPNPIKVSNPHYQAKLEILPNDRALITDQSQLVEYDLKTGKNVWSHRCNTPHCAQRLPNGNTLYCDGADRSVREIAPDGEELWKYTPPDGLQAMRAERK